MRRPNVTIVDERSQSSFERQIKRAIESRRFGPCLSDSKTLDRLVFALKAHSSEPGAKEVPFALLGEIGSEGARITEFVQLIGQNQQNQCTYSTEDLRKIDRTCSERNLSLLGILHVHISSNLNPSHADKVAWLTSMLDLARPLHFLIASVSDGGLRIGAYVNPADAFALLNNSAGFEFKTYESE